MRKLRENLLALFFALFACINNTPHVEAANSDIVSFQGGGVLNNVDVFRIEQNGVVDVSTITHQANIYVNSPYDVYFGSSTIAVTTTTTAGISQGNVYTVQIASGPSSINVTEGMVLCATTTATGGYVGVISCQATLSLNTPVGVALGAASSGTVVNMYTSGLILALTTGTVNPGDSLVTSTISQGYLQQLSTQVTGVSTQTVVGVALGIGTSSGGLTRIKLK